MAANGTNEYNSTNGNTNGANGNNYGDEKP